MTGGRSLSGSIFVMPPLSAQTLLGVLAERFARHAQRHAGLPWSEVETRLQAQPAKLLALEAMERSGGEPDVIGGPQDDGSLLYIDCAPESPAGRRSLCYDRRALDARKANKPGGCVLEMAEAMGVALLSEAQYRELQQFGEFDRKTSSWVATPAGIRELGGALFCDRRYGQVFTYHNGADAYYAARGFRTALWL